MSYRPSEVTTISLQQRKSMCNCGAIIATPITEQLNNGTIRITPKFEVMWQTVKHVIEVSDGAGNLVETITESDSHDIDLPPGEYQVCIKSFVLKANCCYGESCNCEHPNGCLCTTVSIPPPSYTITIVGIDYPPIWNVGSASPSYFYLQPLGASGTLPEIFASAADLLVRIQALTGASWVLNPNMTLTTQDTQGAQFHAVSINAENV